MAKIGKLTVGRDLDTPDTVRTQVMGQAAHYIASMWRQLTYPKPYSRVFDIFGTQVEVTVREKPVEDKSAEAKSYE